MAFYLPAAQLEKVRLLAHQKGLSQSVIVSGLIDAATPELLPASKQPFNDAVPHERTLFWLTEPQRKKVRDYAFKKKLNNSIVLRSLIDQAPDPVISRD
ncbi:hypothetical protein ACIPL1_27525 [Pseudomonas sp. NPDC090202]|uniref:hypothetical protein n=1 Tax=Pseudomonas sp. NPDC090202 TaxID=3364476 RepID=UPI003807EA74